MTSEYSKTRFEEAVGVKPQLRNIHAELFGTNQEIKIKDLTLDKNLHDFYLGTNPIDAFYDEPNTDGATLRQDFSEVNEEADNDYVASKHDEYEISFDISNVSTKFIDENYNLLSNDPEYIFNEGSTIEKVKAHIDGTYGAHYGGKYQATSVIIDAGHGTGFNIGNIIKYAKRYGKKNGYNREDMYKIIHYAIMQIYVHDLEDLDNKK